MMSEAVQTGMTESGEVREGKSMWASNAHVRSGALAALGLMSFFIGAPLASSPALVNGVRDSLEAQEATVAGMAASATALSAGLSLIPGDAMTPIANQLAELSGWFMVIIGSIILQKMLFTAAGFLTFKVVFPVACSLGIARIYGGVPALGAIARRIAVLGVVLFVAVPGSIWVSGQLTSSYTDAVAVAAAAEAEAAATEDAAQVDGASAREASAGDQGLVDRLQGWLSGAVDTVGEWVGGAAEAISEYRDEAVAALNNYIEQIALLIITTCVMPILVFMLFGWVIRMAFSVDVRSGGMVRGAQSRIAGGVRRMNSGISHARNR